MPLRTRIAHVIFVALVLTLVSAVGCRADDKTGDNTGDNTGDKTGHNTNTGTGTNIAGSKPKSPGAEDPLKSPGLAVDIAPEVFRVRFDTTKGKVVVEVHREWAPNGADRFYNLVKVGFFDDVAFFRVIDGFMAQFGMSGDPKVTRAWHQAVIRDDPVAKENVRGMMTFAKTGKPNSRTTQLFINLSDNKNLDRMGFAPFATVVEGMAVVDKIHKVGEGAPRGPGPAQSRIKLLGNDYLKKNFPKMDYLIKATLVE